MLEYTKALLKKVSFDVNLFRKELAKAYQNLLDEEVDELREWVLINFGVQYYLNPIYVVK